MSHWNAKNVKPYKGRLIQIDFGLNQLTGIITGTSKTMLVLDVNKEDFEITIKYESIKQIKQVKSKNKKEDKNVSKQQRK